MTLRLATVADVARQRAQPRLVASTRCHRDVENVGSLAPSVIMLTTPRHFQQANIISVGCVLHSQVIEEPRGRFLPEDNE